MQPLDSSSLPRVNVEKDECPICLIKMVPINTQDNPKVKFLECAHKFHESCIDAWFLALKKRKVEEFCPLCMHSIRHLREQSQTFESSFENTAANLTNPPQVLHRTISTTSISESSQTSIGDTRSISLIRPPNGTRRNPFSDPTHLCRCVIL